MPYYPELNLIFIHIPKTAGGSIEELLLPFKAPGKKTAFRRIAAKLALPQDGNAAYIPGIPPPHGIGACWGLRSLTGRGDSPWCAIPMTA